MISLHIIRAPHLWVFKLACFGSTNVCLLDLALILIFNPFSTCQITAYEAWTRPIKIILLSIKSEAEFIIITAFSVKLSL